MYYYLLYVSSSIKMLSKLDLEIYTNVFSKNNIKNNITGCMLYKDGNIMQYLEGATV